MAIYQLIADGSFTPDAIEAMITAYERTLAALRLIDRNDPLTELIAKTISSIVESGERDPELIKEGTLRALGLGTTDPS